MKNFLLLITILTITINGYSQTRTLNIDSTDLELKIKKLDNLLKQTEIHFTQISDSLKTELIHYKAKEDYFSIALADQSNRFSLIITSLLALLALLSYGGYKFELSRMKNDVEKQLAEQMIEFKEYKTKIKSLDSGLKSSSANTFVTVANNYAKENQWNLAFEFYLCAARDHANSALLQMELNVDSKEKEEDKSKTFQFVLGNLNPAIEMLNNLKADNSFKKDIKNKIEFILEQLDDLNSVDFDEVKDLIAELRIGINNYIK